MTDTPIADAFQEWRHRIRENPDSDIFYSDPILVWTESARACLAQMKPFLDAYLAFEVSTFEDTWSLEQAMYSTYRSHVISLLKELEEKV